MDVDLNSHCSQAGVPPRERERTDVHFGDRTESHYIVRCRGVTRAEFGAEATPNRSKALRGVIWIARGLWLVDPPTRRRRLMALAVAP